MLFKKKNKIKKNEVRLSHYEGIDVWYQDCPCVMEIKDDCLEFRKAIEENVITLNMKQIKMIDYISEIEFMEKYHNTTPSKTKYPREFLVIKYISKNNENKMIAFWSTSFEGRKLNDLKYTFAKNNSISQNYSL